MCDVNAFPFQSCLILISQQHRSLAFMLFNCVSFCRWYFFQTLITNFQWKNRNWMKALVKIGIESIFHSFCMGNDRKKLLQHSFYSCTRCYRWEWSTVSTLGFCKSHSYRSNIFVALIGPFAQRIEENSWNALSHSNQINWIIFLQ